MTYLNEMTCNNIFYKFYFQVSNANETKKPQMILDYNATKEGVDTADQLLHTYTVKRGTRRWPMVLFYNMIDVSALNAYIIWCHYNPTESAPKKGQRRNFLIKLGEELINCNPKTNNKRKREDVDMSNKSSGRCHLCLRNKDRKVRTKCTNCTKFTCPEHSVKICDNCC